MLEYIEREVAVSIIEAKQKELCPAGNYGRHYVYGIDREKFDNWDEIIDAFDGIPAADVAPVRHGRWERCFEDWRQQLEGDKCSVCGFEHYGTGIGHYHYCPNCGAKMDLEG